MKKINVMLVQPTVPKYRVPLFEGLSQSDALSLHVHAGVDSLTAEELLNGADHSGFDYSTYPIETYFGGSLHLQKGLVLDRNFGKGDVLVLSGNVRALHNYRLMWLAKKRGLGVVWWGHGWTAGSHGIGAIIRRQLMRFADVVLLYSDFEASEYKSLGFAEANVFSTNNAIDLAPVFEQTRLWDAARLGIFREQHGIQDKKIVLFCGRLTAKANLGLVIRALPQMLERCPAINLVVIGDGDELACLKNLAEDLRVSGKISWLGAIYNEEDLAPWFLSAEFLVYPGAIGLSLLHSFGYGLPVLTHSDRRYHMPEFSALEDGVNSLTFKRGCLPQLVEASFRVIDNSRLREDFSRAALETVRSKYSMENMVSRFESAIIRASIRAKENRGAGL